VELNGIAIMEVQHHRVAKRFARFHPDAETQGAKVMGFALHPYIVGCLTGSAGVRGHHHLAAQQRESNKSL
jgi:hypothetical protein